MNIEKEEQTERVFKIAATKINFYLEVLMAVFVLVGAVVCIYFMVPELVELVKNYETENKPILLELFRKYPDRDVITLHTRKEADNLINKIRTNK